MGAEMMMGIIIVLNKFSISVASWGYFEGILMGIR
jgi:hypothetical protein